VNPTACSLDADELVAQLERYRAIGRLAAGVEHEPSRVVVRFAGDSPSTLIERTLEVERGCCPFFDIDYDRGTRRLAISVDHPDRRPGLDAIAHALTEPRATGLMPDRGTGQVRACRSSWVAAAPPRLKRAASRGTSRTAAPTP
jgi:hypothetical protein